VIRIATFNVNGVNRRWDTLESWLTTARPDIACLQELKCEQQDFPEEALAALGYRSVWVGQRSWNGVAILSRIGEPVPICTRLPGDPDDHQARYVEAAVAGIVIASIYAPNGNPQPGPKFAYKLAWLERLRRHATTLHRSGAPIILAGDFNVAPMDLDIYPTRSWDDDALIHPESRAAFRRLVGRTWTDSLRQCHPEARLYSFWSYFRQRFERDAGLRIDHILVSRTLRARLADAGVDRAVRGLPGASDHAPVWVAVTGQPSQDIPSPMTSRKGPGTRSIGNRTRSGAF
jgi:exodeoxyribonuclease-3